jgi:hypothetical protein
MASYSAADAGAVEAQVIARLPVAPGGRMAFAWGMGTELRICEIRGPATGQGGVEPAKATVIWWGGHLAGFARLELVHSTGAGPSACGWCGAGSGAC